MEISDPVPQMPITIKQGRKVITLVIESVADADALITRLVLAKTAMLAAQAAIGAARAVEDERAADGPELCAFHGGSDATLAAGCEACVTEAEEMRAAEEAVPEPSGTWAAQDFTPEPKHDLAPRSHPRNADGECPAACDEPPAGINGYHGANPPHDVTRLLGVDPCKAEAGDYICNAQENHDGPDHVAYDGQGNECHRWPARPPLAGVLLLRPDPCPHAHADKGTACVGPLGHAQPCRDIDGDEWVPAGSAVTA